FPLPPGEGLSFGEPAIRQAKGRGADVSVGVSRRATAYADGRRGPSSGPIGPPSPIGRRKAPSRLAPGHASRNSAPLIVPRGVFLMRRLLISSAAVLALCAAAPAVMAQAAAPAPAAAQAQSEDARLNAFFEQAFEERIALSPQRMTALGRKTDYDKLDDVSDAAAERSLALQEAQLARMKAEFDPAQLNEQSRLSWRLFEH